VKKYHRTCLHIPVIAINKEMFHSNNLSSLVMIFRPYTIISKIFYNGKPVQYVESHFIEHVEYTLNMFQIVVNKCFVVEMKRLLYVRKLCVKTTIMAYIHRYVGVILNIISWPRQLQCVNSSEIRPFCHYGSF